MLTGIGKAPHTTPHHNTLGCIPIYSVGVPQSMGMHPDRLGVPQGTQVWERIHKDWGTPWYPSIWERLPSDLHVPYMCVYMEALLHVLQKHG